MKLFEVENRLSEIMSAMIETSAGLAEIRAFEVYTSAADINAQQAIDVINTHRRQLEGAIWKVTDMLRAVRQARLMDRHKEAGF